MFDRTQGIPPVSGSCMISWLKEYVFDIKKVVEKTELSYAMLTDGSCTSHHSPNDVIPLLNENSCLWSRDLNHISINELV